ncbi:MAG: Lrp/AsnC family transcriptional regulator [Gammaproteobacteria bacterium]
MSIDSIDKKILMQLQRDATRSLAFMAKKLALSKTALWNRIQRMRDDNIILKQAALLDPHKVGVNETFFVIIKTSSHDDQWLVDFAEAINELPEIMEAHRLAGDMDYILKVQVSSTRAYDEFYKKLISRVQMYSVSACLSMETLKFSTVLKL